MSRLFSPLALRELTLRNRVIVPPMCQYSAQGGIAGAWHQAHYGARAAGGPSMIVMEAAAVAPEGPITPFDLGLWSDAQADALAPIAAFMKAQGVAPAIQLAHAGRKASCDKPWQGGKQLPASAGGWTPLAPSPLPFNDADATPNALDRAGIERIVGDFAAAAKRALRAGFESVELHAAHGYLMHSFLSPLTNQRGDEYGGSLENRMHFPLAVAQAVRETWPQHLPVIVRISATDWADGGWDLAQSIEFCRRLKAIGIDMIDASSGGQFPKVIPPAAPGFQTPFAAAIRAEAGIPTSAVGLITDPIQAEHILVTEQADAVRIGREILRNPSWPLHAAKALGDSIDWPPQYLRAKL